jgi:hypothetical protein
MKDKRSTIVGRLLVTVGAPVAFLVVYRPFIFPHTDTAILSLLLVAAITAALLAWTLWSLVVIRERGPSLSGAIVAAILTCALSFVLGLFLLVDLLWIAAMSRLGSAQRPGAVFFAFLYAVHDIWLWAPLLTLVVTVFVMAVLLERWRTR